ncbi:hypothetical protein BDK92_7158 [Micromonospora pisi]|uniref:Uncharacterized protein n=1 Tax=Micromonospora pisi TaxID=589240 RepID=A0A495JV24_9ACTN|nr:hypothetical protein [Micromonospora pisi]RKR92681.1 hypothetical protein BDK92_7158 [Micromonospora pisi]
MTEKLSTDPGYRLAYTVEHEHWYAKSEARILGKAPSPSIHIFKQDNNEQDAWMVLVEDISAIFGSPRIQVRVLDDMFSAFVEVAPFFEALAAEQPRDLLRVQTILDVLGFADETERQRPGARLAGHTLPAEGRIFDQGSRIREGATACSCGEPSPVLPSDNARREWHAEHKTEVRRG